MLVAILLVLPFTAAIVPWIEPIDPIDPIPIDPIKPIVPILPIHPILPPPRTCVGFKCPPGEHCMMVLDDDWDGEILCNHSPCPKIKPRRHPECVPFGIPPWKIPLD